MDLNITHDDIALRLGAAVLAGAVIGFDRGARGRIAGIRTTILICVAAAGAMVESNLLLDVTGKTAASFAQMDVLRLPLGILSGIGFIGGGAILQRGNLILGVTTAATLWLVTVVGLVLGAGNFVLGSAMTLIAVAVLALVVRIEPMIRREHRATLSVSVRQQGADPEAVRAVIQAAGYRVKWLALTQAEDLSICCLVSWTSREGDGHIPPVVADLRQVEGVCRFDWQPAASGQHNG